MDRHPWPIVPRQAAAEAEGASRTVHLHAHNVGSWLQPAGLNLDRAALVRVRVRVGRSSGGHGEAVGPRRTVVRRPVLVQHQDHPLRFADLGIEAYPDVRTTGGVAAALLVAHRGRDLGVQIKCHHVRLEARVWCGGRADLSVLHNLDAVYSGAQVSREGYADLCVVHLTRLHLLPVDADPGEIAAQLFASEDQLGARVDGLVRHGRVLALLRQDLLDGRLAEGQSVDVSRTYGQRD